MRVREIMTANLVCASPDTPLQEVARMMVDNDCGGVPVCEPTTKRLVGFVTDRDIVCRTLARGINSLDKTAQDVMTTNLHTIGPDSSVEDCLQMMERFQVRRMPVIEGDYRIIGIVSQADLARHAVDHTELREELEEALEQISEPRIAI